MKKLEAINQVQECMSSVFSKEDVINLINKIDSENKFNEDLALEIKNRIVRELRDIDERKLMDFDSAEFELSYNTIELTNVNIDLDLIANTIEEVLMDFALEFIDKNISEFVEPENPVNGLDMFHLQNAIDAIKIDRINADM
jgi:hypothetical protein